MFVKVGDIDIFYATAGAGPTWLVPSPRRDNHLRAADLHPALEKVMATPSSSSCAGNRTATGEIDALTFDTIVDDLEAVRRQLGLGRVAVLGTRLHASSPAPAPSARLEGTSHVPAIAGAPGNTAAAAARTATYWELIASPERKRIVAENRARLTEDALARLDAERADHRALRGERADVLRRPDLRLHPALGGTRADLRPPLRALLGTAGTVRCVRP